MADPAGDPLLDGLAEGRQDAFAELYDRFGLELFRYARALLDSTPDAEDAVQEVFLGLARTRQTLRCLENLRAYLFTALRRETARIGANRNRRRAVPLQKAVEIAQQESPALPLEQAVQLEQALRELPYEQREVIALKMDAGLTFAEIAAILGISANTAASRYRYALEKLRMMLREK